MPRHAACFALVCAALLLTTTATTSVVAQPATGRVFPDDVRAVLDGLRGQVCTTAPGQSMQERSLAFPDVIAANSGQFDSFQVDNALVSLVRSPGRRRRPLYFF
jgi:hypothetical protein